MFSILRFFLITPLFLVLFAAGAFPMGGKLRNIPMKTCPEADIPDGEFLHYSQYIGGEKSIDEYFVTIKVKNDKGGFFYRIYEDIISPSGKRKLPAKYTDWPISVLIDPVRCTTLESIVNLKTNELKEFESFGVGGMIYSHYQFFSNEGVVRYTSKSIKDDEIITKSYMVIVNPDFPLLDAFSTSFAYRFLDPQNPGIFFYVIPDFIKEPIPLSFRLDKKDTITLKAGTFHVNRLIVTMGDPFIGKLMEPFLKNLVLMIEDSNRRIAVMQRMAGSETVLEEISNVNIK